MQTKENEISRRQKLSVLVTHVGKEEMNSKKGGVQISDGLMDEVAFKLDP